MDNRADGI
jgi:thioredoxin reductase (NADPH)